MHSDWNLHELIADPPGMLLDEHQISDHKHRIISRIKKATEGTTAITKAEIKKIVVTKPRIGYTLNLDSSDVWILSR